MAEIGKAEATVLYAEKILPLLDMEECGCWNFVGAHTSGGYGEIGYGRKVLRTHRITYVAYRGKIPKGLFVCHHCDNPPCCNPEHLFLGTHLDNMKDAEWKRKADDAIWNGGAF